VAIGKKIGDRSLVALALQGIGLVYNLQNNYPKALELRQALGDRLSEALVLSAVAGVYSKSFI